MSDEISVYTERAYLVAVLAGIFPSYWDFSDSGYPEWPVVYVELPTGQASWHVDPADFWIFKDVGRLEGAKWDGHSTDEKYRRVYAMVDPFHVHEVGEENE